MAQSEAAPLLSRPEAHDGSSERDRLLRAAGGDGAAARALYDAHVDRVVRHVTRILGHGDPDVEDVVQRVFLAALDRASSFDGRAGLGGWLASIAVRKAVDEARARGRRRRWGRITQLVGLGRAPVRPDVREEARSDVDAALSRLNPDQRAAFVLHEIEGHTLKEISELTGARISTLHARLKRARVLLDRWVPAGEEGDDHGAR